MNIEVEQDYGFWDDHRSISMTGPITRPQRIVRERSTVSADSAPPTTSLAWVSPSRFGRAPLGAFWKRLGALALVAVLAIAIALAVGSRGPLARVAALSAPGTGDAVAIVAPEDTVASAVTDTVAGTALAESASTVAATEPSTATAPQALPELKTAGVAVNAAAVPQNRSGSSTAATKSVCTKTYKVVVRDYWILIANTTKVSLSSLLAANKATTKTALYAGRTVCLPANASTPAIAKSTPTTVKATAPPAKTTPTTAASPPPAPAPSRSYSAAEVEQIIRDVWPDNLEDHAVAIAKRESNLQPTARNYCCIGLFQIYWSVHKSWLTAAGVTSAEQLLDPQVNAGAAYFLYLRNGGWGPWGG